MRGRSTQLPPAPQWPVPRRLLRMALLAEGCVCDPCPEPPPRRPTPSNHPVSAAPPHRTARRAQYSVPSSCGACPRSNCSLPKRDAHAGFKAMGRTRARSAPPGLRRTPSTLSLSCARSLSLSLGLGLGSSGRCGALARRHRTRRHLSASLCARSSSLCLRNASLCVRRACASCRAAAASARAADASSCAAAASALARAASSAACAS